MNNHIYKTMTNGYYNKQNKEFEFTESFWDNIKNNRNHLTTTITPNITKNEFKSLKNLKFNRNLIIKPIYKV